jgi:hypothetical protein
MPGKVIGEQFGLDTIGCATMIKSRILLTTAATLAFIAAAPALAQDFGGRTLRFGNTGGWYYDGRDDDRDLPTSGFFPGNFAANPANAAIGGAGIFGSTPSRSTTPYPSQVFIEGARAQAYCGQRNRSYNPASGTFPGKDGARHRC